MRVMSDIDVVGELNRVVAIHRSSLATYLADASPWVRGQREGDVGAIRQIASNQHEIANELGDYILELNGVADTGSFPIEFTGYHDLSFDFLAPRIVADLTREIAEMEQVSGRLADHPRAQALIDRAIGAAKAHVDLLSERMAG